MKAKIGVKAIYDLSATPFFLKGSGWPEATLFPWVVSDFSLIEAPGTGNYGTVGVVALDEHGNIAAGTSTGGLTAKRWDRIGDSPLIGAGTYASNQSCAPGEGASRERGRGFDVKGKFMPRIARSFF